MLWLSLHSLRHAPRRLILGALGVAVPVAMMAATLVFLDRAVNSMTGIALGPVQIEQRALATSLDVNMNQFGYCPAKGCALQTDSPATDANYTPNPTYPKWIFDVWYEVTVKQSAFGSAGFGKPGITGIHASPSKSSLDSPPLTTTTCPTP